VMAICHLLLIGSFLKEYCFLEVSSGAQVHQEKVLRLVKELGELGCSR
jgi:hypothetical protein